MNLRLCLVIVFLLFFSNSGVSSDNVTDHEALQQIKKSVISDPYGVLSSWNTSLHFCDWFGITCSTRHLQRVTALSLGDQTLKGSIPPHIGNLTFLRLFNLANNSFSGTIPSQVGRLRRLKRLRLANNSLEGEIPSLINCTKLRSIILRWNKLVGDIPAELGSLLEIDHIEVSENKLTGGIPQSLGNASTLRIFSAGANNLEGNIPNVIGGLKILEYFVADQNNLFGEIPSSFYHNMTSIEYISLSENNLSGELPFNLGDGLHRLQGISMGGNQLSGLIPASLGNASRLKIIDFSYNNVEGRIPKSLGNLLELVWLSLGNNNLGSNSTGDLDVLAHLTNCSQLQLVSLSSNDLGGTLPDSVGNLSNQLTELFLGGNNIHGHIPRVLENLVNLFSLGMEVNALTGTIPESLGKFSRMQLLSLSGNRLSGKIPTALGNLSRLFELDLSQNLLEGSIPQSIASSRNLQRLDFSQNRLSGEIPLKLFSLSQSIQINLSHNTLSGSLPSEVGNLKNINELDLSTNNLSGEIPRTIGDCTVLESLYLQANSFDMNIPSSLASAKGLVNLDLSKNNLSGEIPKELSQLRSLLYLNLSFNDLQGEVPNTGIFQNTSAVSLIGNFKICSGETELQLPTCPIKKSKARMSHNQKLIIIIVSDVSALFLLCSLSLVLYQRKSQRKSSSTQSVVGSLPKVSYQTLHLATNGFSLSTQIGAGSFGTVYKGILEQGESEVAIKVLNIQEKGAFKSFVAECNALKTIRHRNLVKILTCCSSLDHKGNEFKALVFEYMSNGSLDKWLHPETYEQNTPASLNLIQRLDIAADVSCALSYLHDHCEQPIIHCDLKPSNILLDDEMVAHVNDFGLARLISATNNFSKNQESTTGIKGTIGYVAPEYAMGGDPSTQGDAYSYGILILEMFTGRRPTDEMFSDILNLHNLVKMSLPEKLEEIIDTSLLPQGVEEETNAYEKSKTSSSRLKECLISVLSIGLACSIDSPKERLNMGDVTRELQHIKNAYVGV